ncbi:protein phosphatase 2C domain-containing protein [Flavobacterium lindanitolerans]|nr:protein phosphatase 2C domain-containing protein [Flavobacterium lindanitolerans]
MKIYSAIQIGDYHFNNCEDALYIGKFGRDKLICAVMDGCTTAIESQFASLLVCKILKKIIIEKGYKDMVDKSEATMSLEQHLKSILKDLFSELKIIKNQLLLDAKELLTTLIIMIVDKNSDQGIVLTIGDGFVNINGKVTEYEQDNKPDYLGFHISEDFEKFYSLQNQKIVFDKISDISIATDGIFHSQKSKIDRRNGCD